MYLKPIIRTHWRKKRTHEFANKCGFLQIWEFDMVWHVIVLPRYIHIFLNYLHSCIMSETQDMYSDIWHTFLHPVPGPPFLLRANVPPQTSCSAGWNWLRTSWNTGRMSPAVPVTSESCAFWGAVAAVDSSSSWVGRSTGQKNGWYFRQKRLPCRSFQSHFETKCGFSRRGDPSFLSYLNETPFKQTCCHVAEMWRDEPSERQKFRVNHLLQLWIMGDWVVNWSLILIGDHFDDAHTHTHTHIYIYRTSVDIPTI